MRPSLSLLLAAVLAASKVHGYMRIRFDACYNVNGPTIIQLLEGIPHGFDDTPDDDVPDGSCAYSGDLTALPWVCDVNGYIGTVSTTTGGCNNQLTMASGTIETPSGEVVDVMTDSRCEALPCNEMDNCVFQQWRCDVV